MEAYAAAEFFQKAKRGSCFEQNPNGPDGRIAAGGLPPNRGLETADDRHRWLRPELPRDAAGFSISFPLRALFGNDGFLQYGSGGGLQP